MSRRHRPTLRAGGLASRREPGKQVVAPWMATPPLSIRLATRRGRVATSVGRCQRVSGEQ